MHRVNPKAFVEVVLLKVCPSEELDKDGWSIENLVKDAVMNDDWSQHWPDTAFFNSTVFGRYSNSADEKNLIDCLEFVASSDDICVWIDNRVSFIWRMTPKELIKGFEELARIHYQMIKEGV